MFFYFLGLPDKEMTAMELGLAHSLSRYKLKFSPDKIDTMIVQVIITSYNVVPLQRIAPIRNLFLALVGRER